MSLMKAQLLYSAEHHYEAGMPHQLQPKHSGQQPHTEPHAAWQGEGRGWHLVADGEGEPVGDGQAGVEQLRDVPGVGVRGLREAEVDVDGLAVLRVEAAQRAADGRAPVPACSGSGPGQRKEQWEQDMEDWWWAAAQSVR